MDPVTALSIAAAVAPFVELSASLPSNVNTILHSARGISIENEKTEQVYERFVQVNHQLVAL